MSDTWFHHLFVTSISILNLALFLLFWPKILDFYLIIREEGKGRIFWLKDIMELPSTPMTIDQVNALFTSFCSSYGAPNKPQPCGSPIVPLLLAAQLHGCIKFKNFILMVLLTIIVSLLSIKTQSSSNALSNPNKSSHFLLGLRGNGLSVLDRLHKELHVVTRQKCGV